MGRTRRAAIDGGFAQSGTDWFIDSGSFQSFGSQGYAEFTLHFNMKLGGNGTLVNKVTLWNTGVLSLGSATQAQIDFMATGASPIPGSGNSGFPGEFLLFDYDESARLSYSFGIGRVDYEQPFESNGTISAAFFTFEEGYQIILDENGFSIIDEFGFSSSTNGVFIGSVDLEAFASAIERDFYPDFFTFTGLAGNETTTGSEFNDRFISSSGADIIDGQAGFDLVSYANSLQGVSVNLALGGNTGGFAAGDVLINIVDLEGSQFVDVLTGNEQANRFFGFGGNDTIRGGDGNDFIEGGAGADNLDGGAGFDWLSYKDSAAGVEISLKDSTATGGSATGDVIKSFEYVQGSAFDDALEGSTASDVLEGDDGEDVLIGLAGDDFLFGGLGDDFLDGGPGADVIFGRGGFDTVSYAGSAAAVTIDLANGIATGGDAAGDSLNEVSSVIGTAFGDRISASNFDSRLDGGGGVDTLTGRAGNDVLIGGAGADRLTGGFGNDTLLGGNDNDFLDGSEGSDTLIGGAGVDNLQGREGNDILWGEDGNDSLVGGTGSDVMAGGAGDDSYSIDSIGDIVQEAVGGGFDIVRSRGSYTLSPGAEVEQLTTQSISGTTAINLTGNELANELIGNAGRNILSGGGGDDMLRGSGGEDRMIGGFGNDTYFVDSPGDIVQEGAGEGTDDRVVSQGSYALAIDARVERLATSDDAGTAAISLTGSDFANTITGNAGNNVINGGGGNDVLMGLAGADTLIGGSGDDTLDGGAGIDNHAGGTGNDTYLIDTGGDLIQEVVGEGNDRALASVNYTLGAGLQVEQLATTNADGLAFINLTGNEIDNIITGNAGGNFLTGNAGNDTLIGGGGNDALRAGLGNDTLIGGAGKDTLSGNAGNDFFRFTGTLGPGNVDKITDYTVTDDTIQLDRTAFGGLLAGALAGSAFNVGTAATDADDRIIYDQATGQLWFDPDGNAAGAAILFATLTPGIVLNAGEFVVL